MAPRSTPPPPKMHVLTLMAHPCGDPNRATQCRALSVASNSRRTRDVAPNSRYTSPNQGVAPLSGPPPLSHFPVSFAAGRGPRAGGGYRGTFGFRKRIALQGGCRSYSHTNRATLCNQGFDPKLSLPDLPVRTSVEGAWGLNTSIAATHAAPLRGKCADCDLVRCRLLIPLGCSTGQWK